MLKSEILGQYNPSFFSIEICTDDSVIDAINSPSYCSTFIHEYIHFLQDIILPYPMSVNMRKIYLLSSAIDTIKKASKLIRPFHYDETSQNEIKTFSATWGNGASIDKIKAITGIQKTIAHTIPKTGPQKEPANVYDFISIIEDSYGKKYEYHIGARDFLEYIANKIEEKIFPETVNRAPDAPYRIPDFLFDYLAINHVSTDIRMAIVEASLYKDDPANQFFHLIQTLKKDYPSALDNIDECRNCLNNLVSVSRGGRIETMQEKSQRRLNDFIQYLSVMYDPTSQFGLKTWFDHIKSFTTSLDELFLTSLYCMDRNSFVDKIESLYKELGTPIVYNNHKQALMSSPYTDNIEEFIIFLCVQAFFDYIESRMLHCPLKDFCLKNLPTIISTQCEKLDFNNANRDELCPFLGFIKRYQLNRVNNI